MIEKLIKSLQTCGSELTCKDCSFSENGCIDQLLLAAAKALEKSVENLEPTMTEEEIDNKLAELKPQIEKVEKRQKRYHDLMQKGSDELRQLEYACYQLRKKKAEMKGDEVVKKIVGGESEKA